MSLCFCLLVPADDSDKGKKFNARKETAEGEEYYGIKVFRFYIVRLISPTRFGTWLTTEMPDLQFGDHLQDGPEERGLCL